jgi:SAM-dependent methyltransferase
MTAETLDAARERLRPYVERAGLASGWNFDVHSRFLEPRAWDYDDLAARLISSATSLLDIGTGGGERLSRYCRHYQNFAVATESWPPNAPLAASALGVLEIPVVHCDDEHLPFADASFDLVLNRHSGLNPADAARVLRPGGTLLTEQVWDHWRELKAYFPRMVEYRGYYTRFRHELVEAGLEVVDARTSVVPAAYHSLGDFVFMLCVANWTIPDLDPLGRDLETLLQLERDRSSPGGVGLIISDGAFLIEAHKPA